MTHAEFKTFLSRAIATFPTIAEFFTASPDPDGTSAEWFDALGSCALEDCIAALKAMARGDIEKPVYKWDGFTGLIRAHARQLSSERLKENRAEPWKGQPQARGEYRLAEVSQYVIERMAETGKNATACRREIWPDDQQFPTFPPGWVAKGQGQLLKRAN